MLFEEEKLHEPILFSALQGKTATNSLGANKKNFLLREQSPWPADTPTALGVIIIDYKTLGFIKPPKAPKDFGLQATYDHVNNQFVSFPSKKPVSKENLIKQAAKSELALRAISKSIRIILTKEDNGFIWKKSDTDPKTPDKTVVPNLAELGLDTKITSNEDLLKKSRHKK